MDPSSLNGTGEGSSRRHNKPSQRERRRRYASGVPRISPPVSKKTHRRRAEAEAAAGKEAASKWANKFDPDDEEGGVAVVADSSAASQPSSRPGLPGRDYVNRNVEPISTLEAMSVWRQRHATDGMIHFKWLCFLYGALITYVPGLGLAEFTRRLLNGQRFDPENRCWPTLGRHPHRPFLDKRDWYQVIFMAVNRIRGHDIAEMVISICNSEWEHSHICHNRYCINPNHILMETRSLNMSRNECRFDDNGRPCKKHNPPCQVPRKADYERWEGLPTFEPNFDTFDHFCKTALETGCLSPAQGVPPHARRIIKLHPFGNSLIDEIRRCKHVSARYSDTKTGRLELAADIPDRQCECIFEELHLANDELLQWLKAHHCECDDKDLGPLRTVKLCSPVWFVNPTGMPQNESKRNIF